VASLLTILSFNTNKRADLDGFHAILKETKPHLVFLQEVCSYNAASALASLFGYNLTASTLHQAQRDLILVTLTRLPATVQEIRPGMAQLVTVGALPFIHLHAPSADTPTFFTSIRPHLDSPISLVLIGDFNVVLDQLDCTPGSHTRNRCPGLGRILQEFSYTDSFRSLHPVARIYSFHRPNRPAARLDQAYLPPLLESRPRVARYLPTSSDHHAYLLRLETAGLAILPSLASSGPSDSLYRKFNSSLLADPGFLPAFQAMWEPMAASRPLPPPPAAPAPPQDPPRTDPQGRASAEDLSIVCRHCRSAPPLQKRTCSFPFIFQTPPASCLHSCPSRHPWTQSGSTGTFSGSGFSRHGFSIFHSSSSSSPPATVLVCPDGHARLPPLHTNLPSPSFQPCPLAACGAATQP